MEQRELHAELSNAISEWLKLQYAANRRVELSPGAFELLMVLIDNVQQDRSSYWGDYDVDSIQRFAISSIPKVLDEVAFGFPRRPRYEAFISSWEILHSVSSLLDRLCPIDKKL